MILGATSRLWAGDTAHPNLGGYWSTELALAVEWERGSVCGAGNALVTLRTSVSR